MNAGRVGACPRARRSNEHENFLNKRQQGKPVHTIYAWRKWRLVEEEWWGRAPNYEFHLPEAWLETVRRVVTPKQVRAGTESVSIQKPIHEMTTIKILGR